MNILKWLWGEAKEKLNVAETYREIKKLGVKYGRRFFIAAIIWEMIEDVVFPFLSWRAGHPELIPVFLVLHFEPLVYPVFFWAFKTYDRFKGREPWEPDRSGMSTNLRSMTKTLHYRVASILYFWLVWRMTGPDNLSGVVLSAYMVIMTFFSFVHERIWHDSNYGVTELDTVEDKRILLKVLTYRGASTLVMTMVLYAFMGSLPWTLLLGYQVGMTLLALLIERSWANSAWGIEET